MSRPIAVAAKWTGKLLLHLPVYLVTSYCVRYLIGGTFRLLIKAGANLPPQLLFRHFLILSFVGGWLAGVLGLVLLRAMFLLPIQLNIASATGWKNPKAWTRLLPTIVLATELVSWLGAQRSVLASSGVSFPHFSTFFGDGCDLRYGPTEVCLIQVGYTHAWVGTLGYSASPFLPQGRQSNASEREARLEHQPELSPVKYCNRLL
jgi:hypothetical protein